MPQKDDPVNNIEAFSENGDKLNTVFQVDDIASAFPNIPFTDGAGTIHSDLANLINENYRLRYCTAYQIRLAGYKGVLTLKNT